MSKEIFFDVDGGSLAALDHGGAGRPVLLVHGTGHNAAAWEAVAAGLVADHRVVAVDLRGHGHSSADSVNAEQYWRDLAVVVAGLGWERPLLVGHSTGGYAVTAVVAAGLVEAAGICVVDGLVLDDRAGGAAALAEIRTPEMAGQLRRAFGYGRRFDAGQGDAGQGDAGQRDAWIEKQVAGIATDWLNAGADPELVRAVSVRHFIGAVRRPALEEVMVTATASPDAPIFPSVDVYEQVSCPITIVLPEQGFYAPRRAEVAAVVAAAPGRCLVDMPGGHNVVMTHPDLVTSAVRNATLGG
ncbi:pimeloyl-ACP methyl ester carboxylesterase [Actinoplanes lutulentus]|uniref:Pimeloyl-ACP methyl ester carboxylesterase n=1 Tax=Actinoplanes lutulentus TaxID=1287878 RepID=A0A327Z6C2_9ACTN|nr:alpha/beta hydrolase [Actinoplanes lutulentus]RAK29806.1 pimeloyl-ACP methyl ester carboxylesterase [Actinoplanes lutulentus]